MPPLPTGAEVPKIDINSMIDFLLTRAPGVEYSFSDPSRCLITDLCQWLDPRIMTSTISGTPKAWYGEPYQSTSINLPVSFRYVVSGETKDYKYTYGDALRRAYKAREKEQKK